MPETELKQLNLAADLSLQAIVCFRVRVFHSLRWP